MDPPRPFPMQTTLITLPSGREVTVLNLIIVDQRGRPGGCLGIQYRSSLAHADRVAQQGEAREVVEFHRSFAEEHGYSLSAQICNTDAAAQTREPPERSFYFERGSDGEWEYQFALGSDGLREP